jgi:hypothetical protein
VKGKAGGRGKGEEMTQTLYAHMNKRKNILNWKKKMLFSSSIHLPAKGKISFFFVAE